MSSNAGTLSALCRALPKITASDSAPDKLSYGRDMWPRHHIAVRAGRIGDHAPAAVAWPETTEQVAELVRFAGNEGISIVPYGAGSGVCGGILPTPRTLVVDLKRMKRWRRFAPEDGVLEVEAGALGIRVEEELQARGHTIGHFPSSILCSTVGGWVAARGAGQCSGLYGKIEDMVSSLECVDGRGEVATLARRAHGPDLTPLIVGSEGVLAVVTSASFRLHPLPAQRAFGAFELGSMEHGYETIRDIYQTGLRPAVCRLYDPFDSMMARRSAKRRAGKRTADRVPKSVKEAGTLATLFGSTTELNRRVLRTLLRFPGGLNAAIDALGTRALGGAMLVLVLEGPSARIDGELRDARAIAARHGAKDLGEGPARHWLDHRYSVSYRQAPAFMMGAFVDTMEVAATWSQLGALYDGVRRALGSHVFVMAHMSHAYPDGCSIYFTFAGSAESDAAAEHRYDEAWRSAMDAALDAGGTLSHHHGVGRSKAPRMGVELGLGIELVAKLRDAFDPKGVLNPGCLMPPSMPARRPLPDAPTTPVLDGRSQLVHAAGSATLAEIERCLVRHGLSLSLGEGAPDPEVTTVDAWLGAGAPGSPDPWLDPVDHLVAGYAVSLVRGAGLAIRPCPRRAVGPDLFALFSGTAGRAGRIHSAHLRARARSALPLATPIVRQPPISADEDRWIERALGAAASLE